MATRQREAEFVTSPDGTRIAYRRVGAGPPVVVIHGGLGSSLSWLQVAERLADRFEFFLADRRGRGASDDGTPPHSLAREVDDARAVLETAGPGATLIGHSYGGVVALEVARNAGAGELARLVLYEPGVRVAGLITTPAIERMDELVEQDELERALDIGIEQLDTAGLVRADRGQGPRPEALLRIAWTLPREIRALNAIGNDLARYATVTVPTLLMIGAHSPDRQQRNCQALADVLPDVRVEWLSELGHVAHNTAPDQVAALIDAFLGSS